MSRNRNNDKKKIKLWLKILLIVLSVILALCLAFSVFYIVKINKIKYDDGKRDFDSSAEFPDEDINIEGLESRDSGDTVPTEGEIYQDDNVLNILLIGTDDRTKELSDNARADSIMVLSLNTQKNTIKLVSFERAIGVPIPNMKDDWLTHTFRYGGADLTMSTIRDCFKLDVNKYIRVNFNIFKSIVDKIGGVDIELTQAEIDYLSRQKISGLKVGINHLDSDAVLVYSRARQLDSDWVRVERQRGIIDAIIQKGKALSISQLNSLCDEVLPLVQTNLTKMEITSLLLKVPGFSGAQTQQMTIPDRKSVWLYTGAQGRHLYGISFKDNVDKLKDFLYE